MSLNKAFIFAALFLVLIGVTIKSVINKQDDIPDPSPSPIIIVASPLPEEKEEPKFLIINSTSPTLLVNIRSSNSTASEIVQEASHGDKYEYINFENSWYEVNLGNGSTGWVSSTYVTLEEIKQE